MANGRNVRLYYVYWSYTNIYIPFNYRELELMWFYIDLKQTWRTNSKGFLPNFTAFKTTLHMLTQDIQIISYEVAMI